MTALKSNLKRTIYTFGTIFPTTKGKHIFTSFFSKSGCGGPNRFVGNLERAMQNRGYTLHRYTLGGCGAALILSNAPGDYFYALCNQKGVKTVLRCDGFYLPKDLETPSGTPSVKEKEYINYRMKKDIQMADWVIYQSKFSKEMCDQYLSKREREFSIIYNGVDTHHFSPLSREGRKSPSLLLLGSFRDPVFVKGALQVFKAFSESIPSTLQIVGPQSESVQKEVAAHLELNAELKDKVNITPESVSYEVLPKVIQECDISLHIKSNDWCPNAVLESLSCGVPVLCHEKGGTKELIGDAGIYVSGEPSVYDGVFINKAASSLKRIWENIEDYKSRARERAVSNFSLEAMTDQYLDVFSK